MSIVLIELSEEERESLVFLLECAAGEPGGLNEAERSALQKLRDAEPKKD